MKKQNYQWQKLTMGVCYYPEHWPKELWASDLDRMKEAGISTVRVAEFAWSVFEPEKRIFVEHARGMLGSTPYPVKLSDDHFRVLWEKFSYGGSSYGATSQGYDMSRQTVLGKL